MKVFVCSVMVEALLVEEELAEEAKKALVVALWVWEEVGMLL